MEMIKSKESRSLYKYLEVKNMGLLIEPSQIKAGLRIGIDKNYWEVKKVEI